MPLRSDSYDRSVIDGLDAVFAGRSVHLLFIDGDHSYEGVRADHEVYGPLVREGGLIAFHDIVRGPGAGEVPRYWEELEKRCPVGEIVAAPEVNASGIGILSV